MIIKYLSYRKLKHLTLLKLSYHLSYLLKRNFRWGKIIALSIEPTNACNLSCIECPTGTSSLKRELGSFPMSALDKLLNEKAKDLIYLNFYFQGEPFIRKNLPQMISKASERKIYTSVSTNAQLIDKNLALEIVKSGLNRIIISIDGATQEVYEKYRRGGKLEKVLEATRFLNEAKYELKQSKLKIEFQFLVFKHNEHQLLDIKKLALEYKINKLEIKSAQIYDYQKQPENITTISRYSRYKIGINGIFTIKSDLQHRCWRMWHSLVITQDLNVVPCCFDKDAEFILGQFKENSINEIEESSINKKFRQDISDGRSSIPMCQNCSEGLKL